MEFAAICAVLVIAAFLGVILRQQRPEYAMAVGLIAGVGVLVLLVNKTLPLFSSMRELLGAADLPAEYGGILFRALGLCLLTQLSADACRDAGETALAGKAELVGKVALLMLALPLFEKIAELAVSLIGGKGGG